MQVFIAYSNGAMGHTMLAHSLYACDQINFEPDEIFSGAGHAHVINRLNSTNLACYHPDRDTKDHTILWITCEGWYEIMRRMFSYYKYYHKVPEPGNFHEFGCVGFEDTDPLEWLTTFYYDYQYGKDMLIQSPALPLEDYVGNRLDTLSQTIEHHLGWKWRQDKSDHFHKVMTNKNLRYFQRIDLLRALTEHTKKRHRVLCNLQFWEKAVVIAKCCEDLDINPRLLHWNDYDFLENDNESLIRSLEAFSAL